MNCFALGANVLAADALEGKTENALIKSATAVVSTATGKGIDKISTDKLKKKL